MKPKKDNLKLLQSKWYAKLSKKCLTCGGEITVSKTGQKECKACDDVPGTDIETDEDNLKLWSTRFFARHSHEQIQAKQAYYQMAENFLNEYKFETKRDQIIWEYHSNGISVRDIVKVLRKVRIEIGRQTVWDAVNRLRKKMYDMYMSPKKEYHE